jgi:hypothetical protein
MAAHGLGERVVEGIQARNRRGQLLPRKYRENI